MEGAPPLFSPGGDASRRRPGGRTPPQAPLRAGTPEERERRPIVDAAVFSPPGRPRAAPDRRSRSAYRLTGRVPLSCPEPEPAAPPEAAHPRPHHRRDVSPSRTPPAEAVPAAAAHGTAMSPPKPAHPPRVRPPSSPPVQRVPEEALPALLALPASPLLPHGDAPVVAEALPAAWPPCTDPSLPAARPPCTDPSLPAARPPCTDPDPSARFEDQLTDRPFERALAREYAAAYSIAMVDSVLEGRRRCLPAVHVPPPAPAPEAPEPRSRSDETFPAAEEAPRSSWNDVCGLPVWLQQSLRDYGMFHPRPLQRQHLHNLTTKPHAFSESARGSGRAVCLALAAMLMLDFAHRTLQVVIVAKDAGASGRITRYIRALLATSLPTKMRSAALEAMVVQADETSSSHEILRALTRTTSHEAAGTMVVVGTAPRIRHLVTRDAVTLRDLRLLGVHWTEPPGAPLAPAALDHLAFLQSEAPPAVLMMVCCAGCTPPGLGFETPRSSYAVPRPQPREASEPADSGVDVANIVAPEAQKADILTALLREVPAPTLVVCQTKRKAELVARAVQLTSFGRGRAAYLHAGVADAAARRHLASFAEGRLVYLVVTDAVLDCGIPPAEVVVGFDAPPSWALQQQRIEALCPKAAAASCVTLWTPNELKLHAPAGQVCPDALLAATSQLLRFLRAYPPMDYRPLGGAVRHPAAPASRARRPFLEDARPRTSSSGASRKRWRSPGIPQSDPKRAQAAPALDSATSARHTMPTRKWMPASSWNAAPAQTKKAVAVTLPEQPIQTRPWHPPPPKAPPPPKERVVVDQPVMLMAKRQAARQALLKERTHSSIASAAPLPPRDAAQVSSDAPAAVQPTSSEVDTAVPLGVPRKQAAACSTCDPTVGREVVPSADLVQGGSTSAVDTTACIENTGGLHESCDSEHCPDVDGASPDSASCGASKMSASDGAVQSASYARPSDLEMLGPSDVSASQGPASRSASHTPAVRSSQPQSVAASERSEMHSPSDMPSTFIDDVDSATQGVEGYRGRVVAILEHCSPGTVGDADALLAEYEGREEEVIANLRKKFGPEPRWAYAPASQCTASRSASHASAHLVSTSIDSSETPIVSATQSSVPEFIGTRISDSQSDAGHSEHWQAQGTGPGPSAVRLSPQPISAQQTQSDATQPTVMPLAASTNATVITKAELASAASTGAGEEDRASRRGSASGWSFHSDMGGDALSAVDHVAAPPPSRAATSHSRSPRPAAAAIESAEEEVDLSLLEEEGELPQPLLHKSSGSVNAVSLVSTPSSCRARRVLRADYFNSAPGGTSPTGITVEAGLCSAWTAPSEESSSERLVPLKGSMQRSRGDVTLSMMLSVEATESVAEPPPVEVELPTWDLAPVSHASASSRGKLPRSGSVLSNLSGARRNA